MKTLLFCALLLQADVPPPAPLLALYEEAIPCTVVDAPRVPAEVPAAQLNDYFVGERSVWPVLALDAFEALGPAQAAEMAPGLLLPDLDQALGRRDALGRLRRAAASGAQLIITLEDPDPLRQRELLMAWCSLGLCPQAFYLPRGATLRLADLLPATYLSAPWLAGTPEWPLPHRPLELGERGLLLLLEADQRPQGRVAQRRLADPSVPLLRPVLAPIQWRLGGIEFHVSDGQLHTSAIGQAIMALYRGSLTLWPALGRGQGQLVLWASLGFAWLSLMLMVFNLAWLGTGLWRHIRPIRNKQEETHGAG